MLIPEVTDVQHLTTRGKVKLDEWMAQEVVGKAGKEWVEKANEHNVEQMQQDMAQQVPDPKLASDIK